MTLIIPYFHFDHFIIYFLKIETKEIFKLDSLNWNLNGCGTNSLIEQIQFYFDFYSSYLNKQFPQFIEFKKINVKIPLQNPGDCAFTSLYIVKTIIESSTKNMDEIVENLKKGYG